MTVPTDVSRSHYAGNGVTTVFSTGFYFLAASDIRVTIRPVGLAPIIQTLGVHYTVTVPAPGSGAAGSVTMLAAPASGADVYVERTVPFVQDTSFRTQGTFSPAVHEDAMDRLEFQLQELDRRTSDLEGGFDPGVFEAGNGLSVAGITINVGAGAGIVSLADTVAVDFGSTGSLEPTYADSAAPVGGSLDQAARIDHRHIAATAAAGPIAIGDAADIGAAYELSRADHRHSLAAPAAPVAVTKAAAAAGVSTAPARADHKHDVSTAAAVDLTNATNAEGTASTLARSDHTHAHGARGGGTLHDVATTAAAGFMSAADKAKLDGLASETLSTGETKTNDTTPTVVLEWTPADHTVEVVRLVVCGVKTGAVDAAGYTVDLTVRRYDGTTSIIGQTPVATHETNAAWAITVAASSPKVVVTVTGVAATVINWRAQARRLSQVEY